MTSEPAFAIVFLVTFFPCLPGGDDPRPSAAHIPERGQVAKHQADAFKMLFGVEIVRWAWELSGRGGRRGDYMYSEKKRQELHVVVVGEDDLWHFSCFAINTLVEWVGARCLEG